MLNVNIFLLYLFLCLLLMFFVFCIPVLDVDAFWIYTCTWCWSNPWQSCLLPLRCPSPPQAWPPLRGLRSISKHLLLLLSRLFFAFLNTINVYCVDCCKIFVCTVTKLTWVKRRRICFPFFGKRMMCHWVGKWFDGRTKSSSNICSKLVYLWLADLTRLPVKSKAI